MANKGVLVLDSKNPVLYDQLKSRLYGKREGCDIFFSDSDDVSFKLSCTKEVSNIVRINMAVKNSAIFRRYGAESVLSGVFGSLLTTPDTAYDVAVEFDCDTIFEENKENILTNVSDLKNIFMGAPLDLAFSSLQKDQICEYGLMSFPYRPNETMYISPGFGKVVVIFLVDFVDPTEKAFARIFLPEFVEAQRSSVRTAPPVSFSREPPGEIASLHVTGFEDTAGFISFAFEKRHVEGKNKDNAVKRIIGFRTYLNYHIKCTKSYLHERMRKDTEKWLQVLNRAKPKVEAEKTTMSGRTFIKK